MRKESKYEAIVIGGSIGGMDAITKVLACMPRNISFSFLIVLHRLKDSKSPLINLIANKTELRVKEADEKEPILPGNVYFAPANYHVLIEEDKTISLDVSERINFSRPSIDVTFESAAPVYKNKLIGVILTGASHDGSEGLQCVKNHGGLTIVQDPQEAVCRVMPDAALSATNVDLVLPLEKICKYLVNLAKSE